MTSHSRIGLGCMRLSTDRERDDERGVAILHAAFDAGIAFLDTADAYCLDDSERGHNERLIAAALKSWSGDASSVRVATKGGLRRPGGRWEPDGRAKHLIAACHASLAALGTERIHLYQLHALDPRTPLATSVRALAQLKRDGLVERIGLCNVNVGQIAAARRITEIDAIQVELSVWHDEHLLSGVLDYCLTHRLPLLAHRPLGGPKNRQRTLADPALRAIAERHGVTPFAVALAALIDLSDVVVPLAGATQVGTPRAIVSGAQVALTDRDRHELVARFPALGREPGSRQFALPTPQDREVVLVMGLPGAGKSTYAQRLVADGYHRINRDIAGGTLRSLLPALDAAIAAGHSRIVLDNTYVSRKSRAEVIRAAAARGVGVRCVWLTTSVEDAQVNAVWRQLRRHGSLDVPRDEQGAFLPNVQFRYARGLEPPDVNEGFSRVDPVAFVRQQDPTLVNRAVIIWCDDVLLRSRSGLRTPFAAEDVEVVVEPAAPLRAYQQRGWRLLGMSWQPEIEEGRQTAAGARDVFARMNALLGVDVEVEFCPHAAGPPRCWCRKPLPGLGVLFMHRYQLDPAQCLYVGNGSQDPGFARRLGIPHHDAGTFFPRP